MLLLFSIFNHKHTPTIINFIVLKNFFNDMFSNWCSLMMWKLEVCFSYCGIRLLTSGLLVNNKFLEIMDLRTPSLHYIPFDWMPSTCYSLNVILNLANVIMYILWYLSFWAVNDCWGVIMVLVNLNCLINDGWSFWYGSTIVNPQQ